MNVAASLPASWVAMDRAAIPTSSALSGDALTAAVQFARASRRSASAMRPAGQRHWANTATAHRLWRALPAPRVVSAAEAGGRCGSTATAHGPLRVVRRVKFPNRPPTTPRGAHRTLSCTVYFLLLPLILLSFIPILRPRSPPHSLPDHVLQVLCSTTIQARRSRNAGGPRTQLWNFRGVGAAKALHGSVASIGALLPSCGVRMAFACCAGGTTAATPAPVPWRAATASSLPPAPPASAPRSPGALSR